VPSEPEDPVSQSLTGDIPSVLPSGPREDRPEAGADSSSSLITVAENSDDRRAFLRERLALLFKTLALISLAFFVLSAIVVVLSTGGVQPAFAWAASFHLGSIVLQGAVWVVTRRGKFDDAWLGRFDAGGTLLTCAAYALLVLH
jgi:predicted Co/Zn/Cd cation transporter (cation efflux family)